MPIVTPAEYMNVTITQGVNGFRNIANTGPKSKIALFSATAAYPHGSVQFRGLLPT